MQEQPWTATWLPNYSTGTWKLSVTSTGGTVMYTETDDRAPIGARFPLDTRLETIGLLPLAGSKWVEDVEDTGPTGRWRRPVRPAGYFGGRRRRVSEATS